MPRLSPLPLAIALAALAACSDDYPSSPGLMPPSTPEQSIAVEMVAGDSLDLNLVAAERLGYADVANCASTDAAVAQLLDADKVFAVAAGESVIRCVGAIDRRIDPTIDDGGNSSDRWTWVTFDVHLHVAPMLETPDEPEKP